MTSASKKQMPTILNRKLSHNYFIGEKFEAGIALLGTEVKSLRAGNARIEESFVRINRRGMPVLSNAYIRDYSFGNINNHDPVRDRFLLLKRREIDNIRGAIERKGESVFAVKIYFKQGLAKVEIAICKSKKLFDKRQELKKKAEIRDLERDFKRR